MHYVPFIFNLHGGVRQGCPLSGVPLVIGIELVAKALQNDNSNGINLGKKK